MTGHTASLPRAAAQPSRAPGRFVDDHRGLLGLLGGLLRRAAAPWYRSYTIWLLTRSLEEPAPSLPPVSCRFREAVPADLEALHALRPIDRKHVRSLLAAPQDVCFVAEDAGRIIGCQWVALGPRLHRFTAYRRALALGPDEAYMYDAFVDRARRGQGIMPAFKEHLRTVLQARGYCRVYSSVRCVNAPSLRVFEKWGARRLLRARFQRWGLWVRVRCERPRPGTGAAEECIPWTVSDWQVNDGCLRASDLL